MRRLLVAAALAAAVTGCGGGGDDPPGRTTATTAAEAPPAPGPIDAAGIARHLRALERIARRHSGNRAAGTPGEAATVDYVERTLRDAGWRVTRQDVSWPVFENRRTPVLGDLRHERDFVTAEYSGSGELEARVRPFDSEACDAAALGDLDARDVAVVARGTCTYRDKALNAQRAGAGALVVVDRTEREPVAATLGDPAGIDIPVLAATGEAAAKLRGTVRLVVQTVSEKRTTPNLIAETGGAERVVMAGAHLDSVKAGPGINDDGSGIAALLEIARRTAGTPGLRLGFWTGEELGLFGSRRYVDQLGKAARGRIAAYVNLDMVGTPKGRTLVYDTDDEVEDVLREHVDERGEEDLGEDSDHAPFAAAGIAIGGIFTGLDRCYHRACDTVANTDAARAAELAAAAQEALTELAR